MIAVESNKARIAKRVIEVLEYFDDEHRCATVMDIVRRYDRPQSSTSELLSNLVGLGLLYKDRHSRTYSLTPRAALLGNAVQPGFVRDGRLTTLMERLAEQTGLTVAVFSLVGLKTQLCAWRSGTRSLNADVGELKVGEQEILTESAAGWLLMSTMPQQHRDGVLRRINAEASEERHFRVCEMNELIDRCRTDASVSGRAGFGTTAEIVALLVPEIPESQPLAIGFLYEPDGAINAESLMQTLRDAVRRSSAIDEAPVRNVQPLFATA